MILLIPALLLALLAQAGMKNAYSKYSKIRTKAGIPASEAALKILYDNGNNEVSVARGQGTLTDHFDPRTQVLSLSEGVYNSASIAAIGIAAHEAGHAMQKKEGYGPLALRSLVVPAVNFGSTLSVPIFILGLIMYWQPLVTAGIALFSLTGIFALVTLPVEFNASSRAVALLQQAGLTSATEERGVQSVLSAAALTYVAAAVQALSTILYYVFLLGGRRRR